MRLLLFILSLFCFFPKSQAAWIHKTPPSEQQVKSSKHSPLPSAKASRDFSLRKRAARKKTKQSLFRSKALQRDTLGQILMYTAFLLIAFGAFALFITTLPTTAGILAGLGVVLLMVYLVFFVMAYA